jgi:hypothetical protein
MRTSEEWAKKFNYECTAHTELPLLEDFKTVEEFKANLDYISFCNSQLSKRDWKPSDFELDINDEIDNDYCHMDWHNGEICNACRNNIEIFDEQNTAEYKDNVFMNKITKLEAFIHAKFPEFDISDDE